MQVPAQRPLLLEQPRELPLVALLLCLSDLPHQLGLALLVPTAQKLGEGFREAPLPRIGIF